jgi:tRNA dimethylallyltransferase
MLPDVVCLAGPTASGKTAIALQLAEALAHEQPLEIVSVDSALVYRGLDIGTAKPTAEQRAAVTHHLIDIIEPTEAYSAARFVVDARALIARLNAQGKTALLVGGTMLYYKALFTGLDALPGANAALRATLDAQAAEQGWPALHAELARVDPATAARLAPFDAQRIQRALEVFRLTGEPLSRLHGAGRQAPFTPLLIALEPDDRAWLHRRIGERFGQMIELGLLDEVRRLRARGDLHAALPAMRCVGYRQAWQALDAGDLALWSERALAATRQLAKRQLTWLRGMPQRRRVACDAPDAAEQVLNLVRDNAPVASARREASR